MQDDFVPESRSTTAADVPSQHHRTVRFRYTADEFRRGMRLAYNRMAIIGVIPATALLCALIAGVQLIGRPAGRSSALFSIGVATVAGALVGLALLFAIPELGRWLMSRRSPQWSEVTASLDEVGVQFVGFGRSVAERWQELRAVYLRDGLYVMVLSRGGAHFIPERVLADSGHLDWFRTRVTENLRSRARI